MQSGRYGKPMALVLRDDQYFPIQGMYGSTWRSDVDKAGGGTLIEHSIHDLDVINWILGAPESVSAHTASVFGYPGIEDSAALRLTYPGGATASLDQRLAPGHDPALDPPARGLLRGRVPLDRGRLPRARSTSRPRTGSETIEGDPPAWIDQLTVPEVLAKPLAQYAEPTKAFLDALVADGAEAAGAPGVEVALAAHEVVDGAYRSAAAGGETHLIEPIPGALR